MACLAYLWARSGRSERVRDRRWMATSARVPRVILPREREHSVVGPRMDVEVGRKHVCLPEFWA